MKAIVVSAIGSAALLATASSVSATVISSQPVDWTVLSMPEVNYFGPGPESGPDYTWTSTNAANQGGSAFGDTDGYGFGGNGNWDSSLVVAGLNDSSAIFGSTDTMTFAFTTPVDGVGGFMNYFPGSSSPTIVSVYSPTDVLLESTTLTFQTDGAPDQGQFVGFSGVGPIGFLTMSDNFVAVANLAVVAVPEPSTWAMMLIGFVGLGYAGYRRAKPATPSAA